MDQVKWLEERRKGVGGSDISAILGLNPWKTAYQVYREKRREIEPFSGNDATDWGKRLEPAIRQWYSDETGRNVRLPDGVIFNEKYPFMLASLDGFTDDKRIVEIKTARSGKGWGEPMTNEIPDYYMLQVQHYMVVTGFEVSDVPVSIAGGSPSLYEVPHDKELQELIIDACAEFWKRVVDGDPPEPVTYADIIQRFGMSAAAGSVIAPESALKAIDELRSVKEGLDALKAREEELKGSVIKCLGDSGDILISSSGETLCTYKLAKGRETFDSKRFMKEHPELYPLYMKSGDPSRRFLLK